MGLRGRRLAHTSRPWPVEPTLGAESRGPPRARQLSIQLGISHLHTRCIARGAAEIAFLSDHLQLAAHRAASTLRDTGYPADGYSAIRACRLPGFYPSRAPSQKKARLRRLVGS